MAKSHAMAGPQPALFADSHPLRLFPTFLWRAELADDVRLRMNTGLMVTLAELRRSLPPLGPGEAWQSRQDHHGRDGFAELVACVDAAAAMVLDFIKIGDESLRITACWMNVLAPARGHRMHSHPNNFLSGIYYPKTQVGADTVNFHDPRPQTGVIRPSVTELTADNTDQVVIKVADGTLLLFPA